MIFRNARPRYFARQTCTVLSHEAEAMRAPSGDQAIERTPLLCPL